MLFPVCFGALLVIVDQVVKFLVRAYIPLGGYVPFIPHVLELTYVQNTGAAFSILSDHTWVLTLVSVVMVAALVAVLWKKVITHPLGVFPLMAVIAGGVGNLIDRVAFGFVTDMFHTLFMEFAVFNVADIGITVGGVLTALYAVFLYDKLEGKGSNHGGEGDRPADG